MGGERGEVRPGCVLFLLLLAVAAYVGVIVIGSEIDYRSLQREAGRQVVLAAERSDDEIREVLRERVRSRGLPESAEAIGIRRLPGNRINILVRWADTLSFAGGWEWVRAREVRVEGSY